ncbi:MAG: T9SS type A sorting domain-containing protein, partial [Chitinophagaceae bacterium]
WTTPASINAYHHDGARWDLAENGGGLGSSLNGNMRSVTLPAQPEFSPFALAPASAPLPVSLMTFTGKRVGNANELKWVTASESSNRGFSVERSVDGRTYTSVGFVTSRATGGNSSSVQNYSFIDANASGRKWYYRLKQEDLDGRTKLSTVVVLSADKSGFLTVDGVYPNPAKGALSIRLQGGVASGNVLLQLTDMQGRTVKLKSVSVDAGTSTTVTLDLGGLATGQYHLKAIAPDGTASEVITVVKQ